MKRLLLLASAFAAALLVVPVAEAGPIIDRAVAALSSDPVYVDAAGELAPSAADQDRLREKIDGAGAGPVYIAILPNAAELEAGGSPDGVLQAIHTGLGLEGTYATVIGRHFRAGSEGVLPQGVAGRLATEALTAHRGAGVTATLLDFIDRVAAERRGGGGGGGQPSGAGGAVIALLIVGVVAFLLLQAVRRRRRSQAELAEVKAAAHDDLVSLAEDVQKLEQPVESNPQAKLHAGARLV
jgi:hypothetical protein